MKNPLLSRKIQPRNYLKRGRAKKRWCHGMTWKALQNLARILLWKISNLTKAKEGLQSCCRPRKSRISKTSKGTQVTILMTVIFQMIVLLETQDLEIFLGMGILKAKIQVWSIGTLLRPTSSPNSRTTQARLIKVQEALIKSEVHRSTRGM